MILVGAAGPPGPNKHGSDWGRVDRQHHLSTLWLVSGEIGSRAIGLDWSVGGLTRDCDFRGSITRLNGIPSRVQLIQFRRFGLLAAREGQLCGESHRAVDEQMDGRPAIDPHAGLRVFCYQPRSSASARLGNERPSKRSETADVVPFSQTASLVSEPKQWAALTGDTSICESDHDMLALMMAALSLPPDDLASFTQR